MSLEQKLIESGERDRLKELLRQRLSESGWHEQLRKECRDQIKANGIDNVTVDQLIEAVRPLGRRNIPDPVKKELLQQIQQFLAKNSGLNDL